MTMLVGDVGGTKINLALSDPQGRLSQIRRFASLQFTSLTEVVERYFAEIKISSRDVEAICLGVPGPVLEGRCETINLPWILNAREIAKDLGVKRLRLINDLEAAAHGIKTLHEGFGLTQLRMASPLAIPDEFAGNIGLISPGTGLGEATLTWDISTRRHIVSASEGGHADFGPQNEEQIELLRWLWSRHKHVSWEHVASGPAIYRMYRFLKETDRETAPPELEAALAEPNVDPSPIIAARAINDECSICVRALDLWLFCLGAEAGNLALKTLCYGGLFIGGGIVPNILELFRRPAFLDGFEGKGRMKTLIHSIPVYAVTDAMVGLYGAAAAGQMSY